MPGNDAESTLRAIRRRRGLALGAVAGRAGFSTAHLSMLETGKRKLRRLDHITALAAVLRVPPSELIGDEIVSDGEWATRGGLPDRAVPGNCDEIATGRHARLADELIGYMSRGDGYAAGEFLWRMTRDRSVSPWLLLDQLTKREIFILRNAPSIASAQRQVLSGSAADTGRQRGMRGALWQIPRRHRVNGPGPSKASFGKYSNHWTRQTLPSPYGSGKRTLLMRKSNVSWTSSAPPGTDCKRSYWMLFRQRHKTRAERTADFSDPLRPQSLWPSPIHKVVIREKAGMPPGYGMRRAGPACQRPGSAPGLPGAV
jgi:transcriptional regulator with XRE-family HTH domain